jgi:hypothetical protein
MCRYPASLENSRIVFIPIPDSFSPLDPEDCAFTKEELDALAKSFKPWQVKPPEKAKPTPTPPKTLEEVICSRVPTKPVSLDLTVRKDRLGLLCMGKRTDLRTLEEDLRL